MVCIRALVGLGVCALAVAPAAVAAGPPTSASATGTIAKLGRASVVVSGTHRLACSIGPKSPSPHGLGFVIGSRATITCVHGVLTKLTGPNESLPPITVPGGHSNGTSSVTTFVSPPTTATGTITSFGPMSSDDSCGQVFVTPGTPPEPAGYNRRLCASITVASSSGSSSCPIDASFYSFIAPRYAVGEVVNIACIDGVLKGIQAANGSSFGQVSSP